MKPAKIKLLIKEKPTISEIFHSRTKIKAFTGPKLDPKSWPREWKKIHFKTYPRFESFFLSNNAKSQLKALGSVLRLRVSRREFVKESISLDKLGAILFFSAGIISDSSNWDETRRFYPSAGARYPLEVYVAVFRITGLKEGIYHYNVKKHALELLLIEEDIIKRMKKIVGQDWIEEAAAILIISGVFGRTQTKYGDRGYRYILVECGHLGQNIYLVSTTLGLKCCAIGGYLDDGINELLDFDEHQEAVLYMLSLGN